MVSKRLDLNSMSELDLLQAHSAVITELICRKVVKTRNNPIGDYTEWLVRRKLNLEEQPNNPKSFDARDRNGTRYQIKGRTLSR